MNHELNAQVAEEVMGWKRHEWLGHPALQKTVICRTCGGTRATAARDLRPGEGAGDDDWPQLSPEERIRDYCQPPHEVMPDYSGSLDAAWQMEDEIERLGLHRAYVGRLQEHWPNYGIQWVVPMREMQWRLIHTTPEQRCRAALGAVREKT